MQTCTLKVDQNSTYIEDEFWNYLKILSNLFFQYSAYTGKHNLNNIYIYKELKNLFFSDPRNLVIYNLMETFLCNHMMAKILEDESTMLCLLRSFSRISPYLPLTSFHWSLVSESNGEVGILSVRIYVNWFHGSHLSVFVLVQYV